MVTDEQRAKVQAAKAAAWDAVSPWHSALVLTTAPVFPRDVWTVDYSILMDTFKVEKRKIDKLIDSFPE